MRRVMFTLLFWTGSILAEPPTVPTKVDAQVGGLFRFEVKVKDGQKVGYMAAFEDSDCFFDRLYSDDPLTMRFFLQPKKTGTFNVVFWTAGDVRGVKMPIVVGDIGPTPPGPNPPTPPGPPAPPASPLTKALQDAYAAETETDKAASLSGLAALYRQAPIAASRADVQTWGALFSVLVDAAKGLGLVGKIVNVQKVIQAELKVALPSVGAMNEPLTEEGRTKAKAAFERIGASLSEVKP